MTPDPTVVLTKTVRIPAGTASISLTPSFGGGYVISFLHPASGTLGDNIVAAASVTFDPDGTLTYPLPYDPPAA